MPALPKLLAINGSAPAAGMRVDASGGLTLSLAAAGGSFIELRPFGATVVVSCAVPSQRVDGSRRQRPARAARPPARARRRPANGGNVGLSVEVARRVRVREPLVTAGTRVSVEVRSTLAVELRP